MTEEDQHLVENGRPTLHQERESEEVSEDFDSLFADSTESQEDAPVSREEFNRLMKGVQKLASEKGRETKVPVETKSEPKTNHPISAVIQNLYFNQNPEAKEVWNDVVTTAEQLKQDPFELYESSSYFKGEAKAKAESRRVSEENRSKISKPSNGSAPTKRDVSAIKPEDIGSLSPSEKVSWLDAQVKKERANSER
jgi:hypothetical protein